MILFNLPLGTTLFRAHTPQWASRPTSGAGAATRGGRFNREGVEALYLSLDEVTALREYQQTSPFLPPCTMCSYSVALHDLVDLRQLHQGAPWDELWHDWREDWRHLKFELHIEPPTWVLADLVLAHGCTGILFPSQAHEGGTNVVVYSDRLTDGNSVTVNDADGRLPRDQSSWAGTLMYSQPAVFQPPANDPELPAQQRDVQRLLGRCLLRLQQYERLMKAIVAHSDISGPAHELENIRAARVDDAFTKTLGTLVRQLFGSCVVIEGVDTATDATEDEPEDEIHFALRMQLRLSAENYVRTQRDLKELVLLRNNLVHHFIDQHAPWSTEGCRTARDALVSAYERIDRYFEQLRGWAERMDQARRLAAEFAQSDAGQDFMINGILPDGRVNWPAAGIARALREAANELAVDGWTPVAAAGRWIMERNPDQQPSKYGCASWRQVLHESRLFELRYRDVNGQRAAWYRVRTE